MRSRDPRRKPGLEGRQLRRKNGLGSSAACVQGRDWSRAHTAHARRGRPLRRSLMVVSHNQAEHGCELTLSRLDPALRRPSAVRAERTCQDCAEPAWQSQRSLTSQQRTSRGRPQPSQDVIRYCIGKTGRAREPGHRNIGLTRWIYRTTVRLYYYCVFCTDACFAPSLQCTRLEPVVVVPINITTGRSGPPRVTYGSSNRNTETRQELHGRRWSDGRGRVAMRCTGAPRCWGRQTQSTRRELSSPPTKRNTSTDRSISLRGMWLTSFSNDKKLK